MTDEQKLAKKEAQRRWYEKNKERHKANVAARNAEIRTRARVFVKELKESTPCADCGNFFPHFVMDFDHLGEIDKEAIVSKLVGSGYDIPRIKREIEKCELVCANCHRIRTFTRNGMHGSVTQRQST